MGANVQWIHLEYYDYEIRRVVELAFTLAKGRKKKVTSVDKANVLSRRACGARLPPRLAPRIQMWL